MQTKIAYFIMAHHKPEEFLRLINAIYSPDSIYLLHVDGKAEKVLHDIAASLSQDNSNIRLLPSRCVAWGAWSLVQVELDAIRELLHLDKTWTYYINLSGQDFPIITQDEIHRRIGREQNYIYAEEADLAYCQTNFARYYVEDVGQIKVLGDRPPFEKYFASGVKAYYGSQWRVITREFADYAINSPFAFELQEYFRHVLVPDESYFQTLIMNSEYKKTHVNEFYRFGIMQESQGAIRRVIALTKEFLPQILSSNAWFIRKVDHEVDSELIDIIEANLYMSQRMA